MALKLHNNLITKTTQLPLIAIRAQLDPPSQFPIEDNMRIEDDEYIKALRAKKVQESTLSHTNHCEHPLQANKSASNKAVLTKPKPKTERNWWKANNVYYNGSVMSNSKQANVRDIGVLTQYFHH